jgi:hypothetical protein
MLWLPYVAKFVVAFVAKFVDAHVAKFVVSPVAKFVVAPVAKKLLITCCALASFSSLHCLGDLRGKFIMTQTQAEVSGGRYDADRNISVESS